MIMLKKENILHWLFLITVCFFFVNWWLLKIDSIVDRYFFAEDLSLLLRRWVHVLVLAWIYATFLSFFISVLVYLSNRRSYKKCIKYLETRWQIAVEANSSSFWIDMETFKAGVLPQAWILWIDTPDDVFRFFNSRTFLSYKEKLEVDCSTQVYRSLGSTLYSDFFGTKAYTSSPESEERRAPVPESVMESVCNKICEENRKRNALKIASWA